MVQPTYFKFTTLLPVLAALNLISSSAQVSIPTNLVVRAPLTTAGGNLRGEYWKRPPVSIPTDGATSATNRIDNLINGFGTPDGTFQAKTLVYTGNDLTHITNWLSTDAASFSGNTNNMDEGVIRLRGFINITNADTTVRLGTTSDDGSRITIGGIDIINNDGSHGDVTVDTNVLFSAAGVYPIEITYFNGDWTSDGTGANLNHSGNPDPSVHGGANLRVRVDGADVTTNNVKMFYSDAGSVVILPRYSVGAPLANPAGNLRGEYWKRPVNSFPTDGITNPTNRVDELILTFGPADGTFRASRLVYTGNDLTHVTNWLSSDASSFSGKTNNLDDGAFRFTGFLNVTNAGTIRLGTTSDDGSRITIGGIDIINNDGSHGDVTIDTNVVFTAAGLYPIEITYFNGDWTSDNAPGGDPAGVNHSGNPDPSVHGGANFRLRIAGADATTNNVKMFSPTGPAVFVPEFLAVAPPFSTTPARTNGGSSLQGEYWKRPVNSFPTDGITNPTNRVDVLIEGFGPPDGTFQANKLVYVGNDLTHVTNWLSSDAGSFVGTTNNLDDGAFRFTGFLNVPVPGTVRLGTTSDDGSRITISGIDIINNDGSHGDVTMDTNVVFAAAGLYPIEITYFNGDWTSDNAPGGDPSGVNHSGNPDPSVHGGANFRLRVAGADVTTNNVWMFYGPAQAAPPVVVPETLTDGLVAYWNFDDHLFDSVKDFHGTSRGTNPVAFVDGKPGFGKAIKLDGNDQYVEITGGDENELEFPGGSMSISGWFKVDAFDTGWQALIAKGEGSNYRVARRDPTNSIAYAGGTGEGPANSPNVNDGQWHHFVAVTDANTNRFGTALYVDGAIYEINMTKPVLASNARNLFIGENPEALRREWEGEIDDIGIWNRVLTEEEITALHNGGSGTPISAVLPPPAAFTVMDFQFNEGRGTNTIEAVHNLVGVLGVGSSADPGNTPELSPNSPAATAGDLALSLSVGDATGRDALVVNDAIAKALAFATNAPFTIETWINIDDAGARTFEGLGAYGFSYKLGLNNKQLQFTLYGLVDINSGVFPTNGWHHVAAVWEPGIGVEFFLDGTSVTNIAETRVPRAYRHNYLTIGAENVGTTNMANTFQGMIDRFRIHNAALVEADLDSVAATPKAALPSTVVSYNFNATNWPFASAGTAALPAVPNSAPTWTNDTPTGQTNDFALSFAPGTQVIVRDTNTVVELDPADPSFTLQAWVKFQGNPATRQVFYYNNGPGGALSFSVFTNRTIFVTTLGVKDQNSNAEIPDDGNWHHIAVVHENLKEFRFYVDGALADTQAYTGSVIFSRTNQVFYLGSEPTFGLQYTGLLDRVKLTRGILAPEELDFGGGGPSEPALEIAFNGTEITITFEGTLESAADINGPWTAVEGTSPLTVTPSGAAQFYRTRR